MTSKSGRKKKISLLLQSNGYLVLDKDHPYDGSDMPDADTDADILIVMEPVSIVKLAELTQARNLEWHEADTPERLGQLVKALKESAKIIEATITEIEENEADRRAS